MKNRVKLASKRIICIVTILTLLIYIVINLTNQNITNAAQYREIYNSSKIANYPGYKELIEKIKSQHPNWNITIHYTGLDWNQVLINETTALHSRSLVPVNSPSSWFCPICGDKTYDTGSWKCASEGIVAYMMDPRNWLNDDYIFQFENLGYNENQTIAGIEKIISNVPYMQGNTVTYTKTDSSTGTINKSYAQIIMEAAKEAGISPYHLASRIKQEQGTNSRPGSTATGTYPGYIGYYNFLNINASGKETEVIINGLTEAKNNSWTNPEISIKEGAKFLGERYIKIGQNTLYLQKFNVDDSDGRLYSHQYMQNIFAARNEGTGVRDAYKAIGLFNGSIDFVIPVYENMPSVPCSEPGTENLVTQNVKINGTNVYVRKSASTSGEVIRQVNTGDIFLRIEIGTKSIDGVYWDKIVLEDGTKAYIASKYLIQIDDITNCNETVITTGSDVRLRNGPGTTGTSTRATLAKGQTLTRIEKGKYYVDGISWDRVKTSSGLQGYVASQYLSVVGTSNEELIRVICPSGVKIRKEPGTSQTVVDYADKNEILTRIQAGASNVDGYIWDKVVKSNGVTGYIARGDSSGLYIEIVNSGNAGTNNNFKLDETNLTCEPATTTENIKEKHSDAVIKNSKGEIVTSGNVGTGYTVTIADKTYTIVKLGDVNGDGQIKTIDYMKVKNHIMEIDILKDKNLKAADASKDGKISTIDYMMIKNQIMSISNIQL